MLQSTLAGLTSGGAYAALGVCLVLMYRMVGVVNFALAATGAFGTYVSLVLWGDGVPYLVAALVGVAAGAAISALLGIVMATWFYDAGPEVHASVAIAMAIGLLALGFQLFGHGPRSLPAVLEGPAATISGATITVVAVVVTVGSIALAVAMWVLLRTTTTGVRLRAISERPVTVELLGVPARPLTVGVWAIAGALATIVVVLVAPTRPTDFLSLSLLIVPALAAAVVGVFARFGPTVAGGLAIGLLEGLVTDSDRLAPYSTVLPVVVVFAVLLWSQRRERWDVAR
jgi:branched-chain amino acid transport system permease protein